MFHIEEFDLAHEFNNSIREIENQEDENYPVFEIGELEREFEIEVQNGEREYLREFIPVGVLVEGALNLSVDVNNNNRMEMEQILDSQQAERLIGNENLQLNEFIRRTDSIRKRREQEAWFRLILSELRGEHYIGRMCEKCVNCGALFFRDELPKRLGNKKHSTCCSKGKLQINHFEQYPELLKNLLTLDDTNSKEFLKNIRLYNNSFAMACMQSNVATLPGLSSFAVQGQIYHRHGPLLPESNTRKKFAQIHVLDPDEVTEEIHSRPMTRNLRNSTVKAITSLLMRKNVLIHSYRMMHEVLKDEENEALRLGRVIPSVKMTFVQTDQLDLRRYNSPTVNEVAIVYVEGDEHNPQHRELTVYGRDQMIRHISHIDAMCDPTTYPLFFPFGTRGWSCNLKSQVHPFIGKKFYMKEYYSYLIHIRDEFSPILHSRKLFQQFIVDAHIKIETSNLQFHKQNQAQYRMETERQLQEHVEQAGENDIPGQKMILPSSFTGGPRAMNVSYHDAMCIVTKTGKPDLFLTMTCNPKWKEIEENLSSGESALDRPDLIARVFRLKAEELKKDIICNNIFGEVASYVSVYEWQKRGSPHIHMLITLKKVHSVVTAAQTDIFFSAVIPDPENDFALYRTVTTHMIHRKCVSRGFQNAPCNTPTHRGKCQKKFPKSYSEETVILRDSYPTYRRPRNGIILECDGLTLDNRYVVPYNPYLLKKFNCHINLEVCSIIHAVKYLYKYVYKGPDKARLHIRNENEIDQYIDGRYVCAPEAAHKLFGFKIEHKSY